MESFIIQKDYVAYIDKILIKDTYKGLYHSFSIQWGKAVFL